jgi:hypothetical protein
MDLKANVQQIEQVLSQTEMQLAQLTAQKYRLEGARNILLAQIQEAEKAETTKTEETLCPTSPPTT